MNTNKWKNRIIAAMAKHGYYFAGEFPEVGEIHFDYYPQNVDEPVRCCVFYSWEDERLMRYVG